MFSSLTVIDLSSFLLGFFLATLLCVIIIRIRKVVPLIKETQKLKMEENQFKIDQKEDHELTDRIFNHCQNMHLGSGLFPLDSIYINIPLVQQIDYEIDPLVENSDFSLFETKIPFVPEVSDLFCGFPYKTIQLESALQRNRRIMVTGELGSGKTTLLASFISKILKKAESCSFFLHHLPVYIHVSEIDLNMEYESDPIKAILSASIFPQNKLDQLIKRLNNLAKQHKLIIVLDGLDELDFEQFNNVTKWIDKYLLRYPECYFVTTTGLFYNGILENLGFRSYSIAPINKIMANLLIEKWYQAINQIAISTHLCSRLPLEYLSVWMKQDIFQANVFHNTLSILAYLFSDSKIIDAKDTITGFINRFIPIEDLLLFLNKEFSFETRSLLSNKDIERILEYGQQKNRITENNANPEKVLTKDSASYRNFISSGLFIERKHVFFQFSSPILTAFIISQQNQKDKTILWKNILFSCVDNQALQFSDAEVLLAKWIEEDDSPLFRNILLATNYFEFHKYSDSIQKKYINSVTKIIQDDSYPVNLRLRLLPLLYRIDKKLFLQLLTYFSQSSNSAYKQIACFGFCLYSTDREVEILNTLIDDKSEEVHFAALLALSQIWNTQTKKILIDVLLSGNEKSKQFICELLSTHPGEGWEILREITSIDNVLVRKSSIYGLKLINESWIKELLLKMSTEDSQWLIRDLAVSAINDLEKIKNIHEIKPNHPCDSQWLIQFASTHGIGIPSDKYPYELLFNVIEIGTAIERKAAISFLVERPNHQSIELLKSLTFGKSEISEFAINALYRIARTFDKL